MQNQVPKPVTGLLTLHTTSNDSIMDISYTIPHQMIYLRGYRIQMDTDVLALAARVIYLDLPVYNVSKLIDGNPGYTYLPIMLDNAICTVHVGLDLPISMGSDLQSTFRMRILNSSFEPLANLVSATFIFSCETGHL